MGDPGSLVVAERAKGARPRALACLLGAALALALSREPWRAGLVDCAQVAPVEGARVECGAGGAGALPLGTRRVLGLPVDVNQLTAADFESLPGIGKKLAQHIVEVRAQQRGFASVEELAQVKGIGPAKLAVVRDALGQPKP
jgi:competence ComEA-like helix-hairpin-helix protein